MRIGHYLRSVSGIVSCTNLIVVDYSLETAMGFKVSAQKDPNNVYVKSVHRAGVQVMERIANPLIKNDIIYYRTADGREYDGHVKVLHEFTNKVSKLIKK